MAWHIGAVVDGQRLERQAALLVDATGRSASPARRLGGHRIVYDRLVGLVGFVPGSNLTGDRRALIEAVECGWWYSALLPDGRQVGAFMTDADLLPAGQAARSAFWHHQLQQAPHVQTRLGRGATSNCARGITACTSRSSIVAADGWIAVGDAVAAFDPLSSKGIAWALESGLMAAEAIDGRIRGHPNALGLYSRHVDSEFSQYLAMRAEYYGGERRWPGSRFWRRRHTPVLTRRWPSLKEFGEKPKELRKESCSQTYLIK
jgi:flavin-dependent dehydrogenase